MTQGRGGSTMTSPCGDRCLKCVYLTNFLPLFGEARRQNLWRQPCQSSTIWTSLWRHDSSRPRCWWPERSMLLLNPGDASHKYTMTSVMPTTLQGIPPTAANWSSSFLSRFRALSTTSVSQQQQRERSFINKPAKETCCLINEVLLRQTPFGRAILWRRRLRRVMHLQPPLRFFRYRSGPLLRSLRAA